ncbi:hypothetical protein CBL_14435 [Carabus blaptoides fortunei]
MSNSSVRGKATMLTEEINPISLREERRRTGRYVAVTLAICITLLGLCQTMVQHTPVVAGLFAPAIIMFLYVFWVLYTASKTNKQHLQDIDLEAAASIDTTLTDVTVEQISVEPTTSKDINILPKEDNIVAEKVTRNKLSRTYSIA